MTASVSSEGKTARTIARHHERAALLCFTAVLAVWGLTLALTWDGYGPRDEYHYINHALQWAETGIMPRGDHWALRLPLVAPMALLFSTVGPGPATAALPNMLYGLGLIVVSFIAARHFFGLAAATGFGLLLATSSVFVMQANEIRIFGPEIFFVASALWLTEMAIRSVKRRLVLFAVAGLCVAGAWLCRESTAFLGPLLAAWIILRMRRDAVAAWPFVAAAVGVLIVELAAYAAMTGDPLYRALISTGHGNGRPGMEALALPSDAAEADSFLLMPLRWLVSAPSFFLPLVAGIGAGGLRLFWPVRGWSASLLLLLITSAVWMAFAAYALSLENPAYYSLFVYVAHLGVAAAAAFFWMRKGLAYRVLGVAILTGGILTNIVAHDLRDGNEWRDAQALRDRAIVADAGVTAPGLMTIRLRTLLRLEGLSLEEAERRVRFSSPELARNGVIYVYSRGGAVDLAEAPPCTAEREIFVRDRTISQELAAQVYQAAKPGAPLPLGLAATEPLPLCFVDHAP